MEAFSHCAVFPGNLDEISAGLDEEVAVMAEIFQEANDILRFQSEQTPIFMLDQSHVACIDLLPKQISDCSCFSMVADG